MKAGKSISSIMVSVSVLAFAGFQPAPAFGQVVINCSQGISIGKNIQCGNKAKLVINPDSSTSLKTGCVFLTSPPKAGKCAISTGGVPPTKSVIVDFAKSFVNIQNGTKQVLLDKLRMQYKSTIAPASKFTFTPTAVSNGIQVKIGGTVNITTSNQGIGSYSGNVTIRAN